jgi:hypothetical protein
LNKSIADKSASTLRRDKAPVVAAPIIIAKKPRLSADVDTEDYNFLLNFCQDIAMAVGRVKVKHVWVIRALIRELRDDKDLKARIIERVREENPIDA